VTKISNSNILRRPRQFMLLFILYIYLLALTYVRNRHIHNSSENTTAK